MPLEKLTSEMEGIKNSSISFKNDICYFGPFVKTQIKLSINSYNDFCVGASYIGTNQKFYQISNVTIPITNGGSVETQIEFKGKNYFQCIPVDITYRKIFGSNITKPFISIGYSYYWFGEGYKQLYAKIGEMNDEFFKVYMQDFPTEFNGQGFILSTGFIRKLSPRIGLLLQIDYRKQNEKVWNLKFEPYNPAWSVTGYYLNVGLFYNIF